MNMKRKRLLSLVLAFSLLIGMVPFSAHAETVPLTYAPYPKIQYDYSATVTAGTIRYIHQTTSNTTYHHPQYWPTSAFGYYSSPNNECGTSCISMALSYIGINRTPYDILTEFMGTELEGRTVFQHSWGGAQHITPVIADGTNNYINGNGKYSPVIIFLNDEAQEIHHYIMLVGRISENRYTVIDPARIGEQEITINGDSATYFGQTAPITQRHQYYNPNAQIDHPHPGKPTLTLVDIEGTSFAYFNWNETTDTTHYKLTLSKKTNDTWQVYIYYDNLSYSEYGQYSRIAPGDWKAELTAYNDYYSTTSDAVYFTVDECAHDMYLSKSTDATCTSEGSETYSCTKCNYSYTNPIPVKHDYIEETIPGTCTEYPKVHYTCKKCGNEEIKQITGTYSEWSATKPTGVAADLIQTKIQYRYQDYVTKTSYNTTESGWERVGDGQWIYDTSASIEYVADWPSGFDTTHALYTKYNLSPKTATETETKKVVPGDTTVVGYLYYHWCSGNTTTAGAKDTSYGIFTTFHAFFSTEEHSDYWLDNGGDGSYKFSNAECCTYSPWFYPINVYSQSYSTYNKLFTYGQWEDWSDWSDTFCASSETRNVETRTLYRYCNSVSDWSEIYPENVAEDLIQAKTQYRYSEQITETNKNPSMAGATLVSSNWVWNESGAVEYVKDWPSGFKTDHTLYSTYNNAPPVASETNTTKTTVGDETIAGYLYYHWCTGQNTSSGIPGDNSGKAEPMGAINVFHAFFSTDTPPGQPYTDGSYVFPNADCCKCSYWYFPITVYSKYYSNYTKEFTHAYWSDWSSWSDTIVTPTAERQVETRTMYRYATSELGEHNWDDGTVTTEATCTVDGVKTYACTKCTETYTEVIPASGHLYLGDSSTEPGCESEGVNSYICSNCGHNYTVSIPATGHNYSSETVAPTCSAAGYTLHTCTNCGSSYQDNPTPALGHDYQVTENVAPDCENGGYCVFTCTHCGDSYHGALLEPTGHDYKVTETFAPTCDTAGYTLYTCATCGGNYEGDYVNALGHSYKETEVVAPTCTTEGFTVYTCTVCADSYHDNIVASLGHTYGSGNIETLPNCTDPGMYVQTCTVCQHRNELPIGATGHSYTSETVAPTCTEQGYTRYTCSKCGDIYDDDYVEASGHNHVYQSETQPGCETPGMKLYVCTSCGDSYEEEYAAPTGHSFGGWKMEQNATCTTNGVVARTCSGCGARDEIITDASGHNFADGKCTTCGAADPDYAVPVTAPTVAMKFPSLSFEDVIIMNVYYTATDIQNVVEMGLLTYTEKPAEGSVETADHVVPGYDWSEGDQMYYSSTAGIAPKDLGDTIYFGVYWKLTDGTYGYSKILGYSPKTYAMNMLKTGTTEMKTLVAAMLNYGTAAQNYFGYNTDTLVGADMTEEQKALVAAYEDSMIATAEKASGDKLGTFINDKTYSSRYATVTFEGAFCINYYYTPSLAVEGDVMMYIWDLEAFESNAVLTKENATKAIKMSLTDSGEYTAMVDGIAAKDLDKGVYVSFVYSDGTTEHCGGVLTYTIGTYCKTQAAKTGTLAELAKACVVYGYYAKQLFN